MVLGQVSIIIPCYKMGDYVGDALNSVGKQDSKNWEVIVVDDAGPEDGTRESVEAFAEKFPSHRIEYIRHQENGGVSAARNTAIEASRGEYLAFLDPDDLWHPKHLERVAEAFGNGRPADVVTGPVFLFRGGDPVEDDVREIPQWVRRMFPASLASHNFIQPCATVVRKSAIVEVGPFDTDPLLQHVEDYDLWIRLAKAGKSFRFLEKPTTYYRKHSGAATSDLRKMNELGERLADKHAGFLIRSQGKLFKKTGEELEKYDNVMKALRRLERVLRFLRIGRS